MERLGIFFLFTSAKNLKRKHITCPHLFNSGLILERNMHFVVANIVRPLTQSKGVSFVSLWGWQAGGLLCVTWHAFGKVVFDLFSSNVCAPFVHATPSLSLFFPVTFVRLLSKPLQASLVFWVFWIRSHSWGTSFPHFVHSIQCHALSKEGPTSWIDAAYWICSFATWRRTVAHCHGGICVWRIYWQWHSVLKPYSSIIWIRLYIILSFDDESGIFHFPLRTRQTRKLRLSFASLLCLVQWCLFIKMIWGGNVVKWVTFAEVHLR